MRTSKLIENALDWAVCEAAGLLSAYPRVRKNFLKMWQGNSSYFLHPSTDWAQGGPIIDREGISVIKLEHGYGIDSAGYTTCERIPVFGAVVGEYFDTDQLRNSYGEDLGEIYYIGTELVTTGPTPLVAAMRCFVASKLGDEVEVPDGIL